MTRAICFKDRKQTRSNKHDHYRFVSGEAMLQLYTFTVQYGTHDQDLRTGAGGMITMSKGRE